MLETVHGRGEEIVKKSRIAPLNAIIILFINIQCSESAVAGGSAALL